MAKTQTYSKSQRQLILDYLADGGRLSSSDARAWWGVERLAARIGELILAGWPIESKWRTVDGKRFTSYRMRGVRKITN
jgi:hypothetical protein